jgi:hypothetical protein
LRKKDVEPFIKFAKDKVKSLCILLDKRLKGDIIFESESSDDNFLKRHCHHVILPFMKGISESNEVILDPYFAKLFKYCALAVQRPDEILIEIARRLTEMDYNVVFSTHPTILEDLAQACMHAYIFDIAQTVISEVIRTINISKKTLNFMDLFILGRFYLFWYACDPQSHISSDRLIQSRSKLHDSRKELSKISNETPQIKLIKTQTKETLSQLGIIAKIKDAKNAVNFVLRSQFPNSTVLKNKNTVKVEEIPISNQSFSKNMEKLRLKLKNLITNKDEYEILEKPVKNSQKKEEYIERDKDTNCNGDVNEYIHEYDAERIKAKKRRESKALEALAQKRLLKKVKVDILCTDSPCCSSKQNP